MDASQMRVDEMSIFGFVLYANLPASLRFFVIAAIGSLTQRNAAIVMSSYAV
jgi:hypothetical protein